MLKFCDDRADRLAKVGFQVKKRLVLSALNIIAPERIQNLILAAPGRVIQMQMAAGAESVSFPDFASKQDHEETSEAKILEFPKKKIFEIEEYNPDKDKAPEKLDDLQISSTEFELWQKEMGKKHQAQARDPHASYEKSAQIYIVKTKDPTGKTQTKLARLQGVLLDRKSS